MHYLNIIVSFSVIYNEMRRGFPPISGQITQTSGSSDWPNKDPHMAYNLSYLVIV